MFKSRKELRASDQKCEDNLSLKAMIEKLCEVSVKRRYEWPYEISIYLVNIKSSWKIRSDVANS